MFGNHSRLRPYGRARMRSMCAREVYKSARAFRGIDACIYASVVGYTVPQKIRAENRRESQPIIAAS